DVDCLCVDCNELDSLEDEISQSNKEIKKSELNAMYCRGRDDGFEAGRLQGIKQERALWELARIGQEIEAEAEKQERPTGPATSADRYFYDAGFEAGRLAGIKITLDEWAKSEPPVLAKQEQGEPVGRIVQEFYEDGTPK
ncbi:hypothetical protein, partial [Salmonella enterica]|uniref:hypothetical protein n=1 Tax=Salmonella enterica TaxID=28901 RepID=UPI0035242CFB